LGQCRELAQQLNSQEQQHKNGLEEIGKRLRNTEKAVEFEERQFRLYEQNELLKLLEPIFVKRQRSYWLAKLPHVRKVLKKKEAYIAKRKSERAWKKFFDEQGILSLYYITHADNLESILENGVLSHTRASALPHHDISMREVNRRRERCEDVHNRPIHNYVPLYFNSRNPMLYVRRDLQQSLVILSINRDLLFHNEAIVTDGNAACGRTKFMKLDGCRSIDWDCVFGSTWFDVDDGKRKRCAETLIPDFVKTEHIQSINCNNPTLLNLINKSNPRSIPVQIETRLFF
jgi:hypothetical protein